jgi:hypothetical protein
VEHALPHPHPLIKEARGRQRRRRTRLVLITVAIATFAVATYAVGGRLLDRRPVASPAKLAPPNPCTLLTNAEVASVFGATVAYKSSEPNLGCTWSGRPFERQYGQRKVTLDVARVTRADFDGFSTFIVMDGTSGSRRIAKSARIQGVGEAAFAQIFAGVDLEVYYRGFVVTVTTSFVGSPLAAQKRLAAAAIARLEEFQARADAT